MKLRKVKKYILICVLSCFISFEHVLPISEETADFLSVVSGVATTGAGYLFLSKVFHTDWQDLKLWSLSAIMGGAITPLWYNFWIRYTPEGRFKRSVERIGRAEKNKIVDKKLSSEEIISLVSDLYSSSNWPLVEAKDGLDRLRYDLIGAKELLKAALDEKSGDTVFCQKCKKYLEKINPLLCSIINAIKVISAHENYNIQYNFYQNDKLMRQIGY